MAHVVKYNQSSCGHMLQHYAREAETYSNKNIDSSYSYRNKNLAPKHEGLTDYEFMKKRISEVYHRKKADNIILCDWVVTFPKDLEYKYQGEFFRFVYEFLSQRYGEENVVSAYVHLDETSPHMHFAFVPVAYDGNKQRYKLCAKEVLNRNELRKFHTDLSQHLKKRMGFAVNVLNGVTAAQGGNKSVKELLSEYDTVEAKKRALREELAKLEREETLINKPPVPRRPKSILNDSVSPASGFSNKRKFL